MAKGYEENREQATEVILSGIKFDISEQQTAQAQHQADDQCQDHHLANAKLVLAKVAGSVNFIAVANAQTEFRDQQPQRRLHEYPLTEQRTAENQQHNQGIAWRRPAMCQEAAE